MRIIVTGGAGFLGRSIVKRLQKDNTVRVYDKSEYSTGSADSITGDILDYDKLARSCEGFDAMVHLAAKKSVAESVAHPEITNKTNVSGTINVLNSCVQNGIKRIVFASSAAVYGSHATPVSEKTDTKPVSPYGLGKLEAERHVLEYSEKIPYNITLRIFNAYGTDRNELYTGVIPEFARNISKGLPVIINGDGEQTRDFVSVGDVAYAFERAVHAKKSGVYNVGTGEATSINSLAEKIAGMYKKNITIVHAEKSRHDIMSSTADTTLARDVLGFQAGMPLDEGLKKLVSVTD